MKNNELLIENAKGKDFIITKQKKRKQTPHEVSLTIGGVKIIAPCGELIVEGRGTIDVKKNKSIFGYNCSR